MGRDRWKPLSPPSAPCPPESAEPCAATAAFTGALAVDEFRRRVNARASDHASPLDAAAAVAAGDPALYRECQAAGMPNVSATVAAFTSQPAPRAQGNAMADSPLNAFEARNELERRVATLTARGMKRERAVSQVFAADPALRESLRNPVAAATPAAVASTTDPIAEVDKRVAELKARGIPHARAVCQVFHQNPQLHASYVAEYKMRHTARQIEG